MFLIELIYAKKYGKIICAALEKNNKRYFGKRHCECFVQEPKGVLVNAKQGFLTSKGYFVDRKKALHIAKYYKQIKQKHPPYDELMSEDMY